MKPLLARWKQWRFWLLATALVALPAAAYAHERFIKHTPKMKVYEPFFDYVGGNQLNIATRVAVLMALMMFVWFIREPLDAFINNVVLKRFPAPIQELGRHCMNFAFDKPVEVPWFKTLHQWIVIFFLRCPALVLMFAAANKSLVMPSYPLEPNTTAFFQFAQVVMAIGILTQSFLPFGGATIFGTFIYLLFAYDWKIAVDVLPVLTVAVIYVSSPWDTWKRVITSVNTKQMRWVRIILGFGFFALGWMKMYNYYLTVGVADNYASVMNDPMVLMFYAGTTATLKRECWIMAFAMAEVMTGFLIMVGMFSRVWCLMMVYVFSKLMIVDFGWEEIPHLYPIGAFLLVMTSNNLTNEFTRVDERAAIVAKTGKNVPQHILLSLALAVLLTGLAIYPMLSLLTQTHPKPAPNFEKSAQWVPDARGGGNLLVQFGAIPPVAGENAQMHYKLRAQVLHDDKTLTTEEWLEDAYPKPSNPELLAQEATHIQDLHQGDLKTGDQETRLTLPIPPPAPNGSPISRINSLTVTLLRVEDKKGENPVGSEVPIEAVRGFKVMRVNWNPASPATGSIDIQPLPQISGDESQLNGKFDINITKEGKPDAHLSHDLSPSDVFSSNRVTTITLPLEGFTANDGILVTGKFTRTDDKEGAYPKNVIIWNRPVKLSDAEKAKMAQSHQEHSE